MFKTIKLLWRWFIYGKEELNLGCDGRGNKAFAVITVSNFYHKRGHNMTGYLLRFYGDYEVCTFRVYPSEIYTRYVVYCSNSYRPCVTSWITVIMGFFKCKVEFLP